MTILKTSLTLLAVVALVWMSYRIGRQMERSRAGALTACEKAIEVNNDGRLAMMCDGNTLFVWSKETGEFVGAVNFDKARSRSDDPPSVIRK